MANQKLHSINVTAALAAARAAPLSAKKALLAALLLDAEADRLFAASGETDILDFRARLAAKSDALALVFALCALRPDGPHLVTEAVQVPIADYPGLSVQDFMVSLYNDHSVQRVRIAVGDERHDVHEVLAAAFEALRA
ncbi:MAG: hypothetical protein ABI398_04255 [Devosia sp.]